MSSNLITLPWRFNGQSVRFSPQKNEKASAKEFDLKPINILPLEEIIIIIIIPFFIISRYSNSSPFFHFPPLPPLFYYFPNFRNTNWSEFNAFIDRFTPFSYQSYYYYQQNNGAWRRCWNNRTNDDYEHKVSRL